jgi:hypothetical protein
VAEAAAHGLAAAPCGSTGGDTGWQNAALAVALVLVLVLVLGSGVCWIYAVSAFIRFYRGPRHYPAFPLVFAPLRPPQTRQSNNNVFAYVDGAAGLEGISAVSFLIVGQQRLMVFCEPLALCFCVKQRATCMAHAAEFARITVLGGRWLCGGLVLYLNWRSAGPVTFLQEAPAGQSCSLKLASVTNTCHTHDGVFWGVGCVARSHECLAGLPSC